jgi:RimJ/RimL family protein N-acetyltransferase
MAADLSPHSRYTPRLLLRPFRRRDVDSIHEAVKASIDDLQVWLPWASRNYSRLVSQQFVRESIAAWSEGRAFDFTVRRPEDPQRHLGNVSIWHTSRQNRVGEIGYWVRSDETRRGVCTESVAHLLQIAFQELGLHRVTLRIADGNRASDRIAEKLGFLEEGVLREDVKIGDHWVDHTLWGLLNREWEVERERYAAQTWM